VDVYKIVEGITGIESTVVRVVREGECWNEEVVWVWGRGAELVSSLVDYNFGYFIRTNSMFVNEFWLLVRYKCKIILWLIQGYVLC
jgi:hypothetical protein